VEGAWTAGRVVGMTCYKFRRIGFVRDVGFDKNGNSRYYVR
jgi:hypothetical protein